MILIDTDHTTYLKYPESERGARLIARLNAVPDTEVVGVAIVAVEEPQTVQRMWHLTQTRLACHRGVC